MRDAVRNVTRTLFAATILVLASSVVSAADNRPLVGKYVTVIKPDANFYLPNRRATSPALLGSSHLIKGV